MGRRSRSRSFGRDRSRDRRRSCSGKPGAAGPTAPTRGPWALFRLLDAATVRQETPLKYLVTVQAGGRTASLLFEASSAINPFGQNVLRGFGCGG